MFGHEEVEATARVVDSALGKPSAAGPSVFVNMIYVVDVAPENGALFRAKMEDDQAMGIPLLDSGDSITVRYNPKKPETVELVKKGDPRFDAKLRTSQEQRRLDALMTELPGSPAPRNESVDPDMEKLDKILNDLTDD